MSNVKKFTDYLTSEDLLWLEADKPWGLRAVTISGPTFRAWMDERPENLWDELKRQLPDDALVMDGGTGNLMLVKPGTTGYYDAWVIIFASKEWEPITDGGPIPEYEVDL